MRCFLSLLILSLALTTGHKCFAWGAWGHNHINKGAVLALPPELGMFFYCHVDFMVQESTVPDLRKYTLHDKEEHPRHYINLESYGYPSTPVAHSIASIRKKYSKERLEKYGILPWYMEEMVQKLTDAFKARRKTEILFLAADLGHYAGDAHVPLHTTVNHNGQLTGQHGIHAFWESQLPELFGGQYNLYVDRPRYIKDIPSHIWEVMDSTYALLEPLLTIDQCLKEHFPAGRQYEPGADGAQVKNKFGQPVHTYAYAQVYHELLDEMVEDQLKRAIRLTADLWYTAWVNAGRPNLNSLDGPNTREATAPQYRADMDAWKRGTIYGCNTDKEFPAIKRGHRQPFSAVTIIP